MQHTPPISPTLVRSTNREFPHYAVFSGLLLTFFILGPNIFLSIPFLNTLSLCSSLSGGPYFTSIKNKRQNNDLEYFNFYISKLQVGRQKRKFEPNGVKHILNLIFSWFSYTCNFDWLMLFANIWTLPHFESIFSVVYYNSVLYSVDEWWIYIKFSSQPAFILEWVVTNSL